MQYTTQQLQGGSSYSVKTRIGNWCEDMELQAIKEIDYNDKRAQGSNTFGKTLNQVNLSYKNVPWTYSPDRILRSGDTLMFKNKKTDGFLVFNTADKQSGILESFIVTTTKVNPGPVARSVFCVKRAEKVDIFGADNIIRYGQKVKIEANPHAYKKPLYLSSTPYGVSICSPVTRCQEVSMNAYETYNATWIIEAVDPNIRLEMQG